MLRKVFLCGGILTIAAGTSFQVIVAMLVQFFYILLIESVMPYKHFHDDVVQLIGSIQLFLTLMAGLALKLMANKVNTHENIDEAEQTNIGILLIALNSVIFVASCISFYLATPHGQKRFAKQMAKTKVAKTKVAPHLALEDIRKSCGASSEEYKKALMSLEDVNRKKSKEKSHTNI
eukprot:g7283.t1